MTVGAMVSSPGAHHIIVPKYPFGWCPQAEGLGVETVSFAQGIIRHPGPEGRGTQHPGFRASGPPPTLESDFGLRGAS
jgi:hypothetical protein